MIRLLIARHGNTFDKGEVIRRVGRRTDLPLSQSGCLQAERLGRYLSENFPNIEMVYTSELQRTIQTAHIIQQVMGRPILAVQRSFLNEIDYGPDEGQPEEKVLARIGKQALTNWETQCIIPDGWQVEPVQLKNDWIAFGHELQASQTIERTVLVVTSNGIARFAPNHFIKLATGAFSLLHVDGDDWQLQYTVVPQ